MGTDPTNGNGVIEDENVIRYEPILSPLDLKEKLPVNSEVKIHLRQARSTIRASIDGVDPRIMVVNGPCSIHDIKAAEEYAGLMMELQPQVSDVFYLVMRSYFQKPRTTVGWKGLTSDPDLDDSFDIEKGLYMARSFLMDLARKKIPLGTESVDANVPQYLNDLVAWAAIGARTTEAPTHREMASGFSMPVGFKNGTSGDIEVALNAMEAARKPHTFLGINEEARLSKVYTKGNKYTHIVLRGGSDGPNYASNHVDRTVQALLKRNLPARIVIDCSHDNSRTTNGKDYRLQPMVIDNVLTQAAVNPYIFGIMVEANLREGNQKLIDPRSLQYGVSITDSCISFDIFKESILRGVDYLRKESKRLELLRIS